MFQNKMLILLKLCVSVWVLVLDAGAQVDNPSVNSQRFTAVILNTIATGGAPTYVYHGSVYIRVNFYYTNSTFVMTYQEVDFEENICTLPSLVFADTTVQEVVTPNFGNGPYFDSVDCEVMIESSIIGAREVKVEVMSHNIECCCDGVRICDDDGCLNLCSTSKRIFSGSNVTIHHWSDYLFAYNGTRLEYTILLTGLRGRATPVTVTVPPNNALSTTLEQGLASRTAAWARRTRNEPGSAEPRVRIASSGISSGLTEYKE
ncbi:uncharacterized protein [Haliotis cracherodii]|uniref:uncharacterized protein isoform X3 n=1 Tax=Haliotis cracherodii TaxID=6455 RepID=UPI0039E900BC